MQLGLSETTCPQRLREQNPVKVVFVLYNSEPSRSYNRLCPLFLLVTLAPCMCRPCGLVMILRRVAAWLEFESLTYWIDIGGGHLIDQLQSQGMHALILEKARS
jgi:hypothetical protein